MADIIIRIGTRRNRVPWSDCVPVLLEHAEPIIRRAITTVVFLTRFDLDYIGGWVWQVRVDGRLIGTAVVITET